MQTPFAHIDTWIFDLDLTLYGPEANIMAQVRDRIALFVEKHFNIGSDEAHKIRHTYWKKYGTTLGGLMAENKVEPNGYLDFVHDVDMDLLRPDADLRRQITSLPGRKIIFTNADAPYAERVLAARGLDNLFEDIFDIHRMQHLPKPAAASYDSLCAQLDINPARALFVEDSAHNLVPAKVLGMTTIWVNHGTEAVSSDTEQYIDQEIADLNDWLSSIHTIEGTI
ncbi:COG1011 Predicted hydrolase (HAD superfamily) [Sphingomonadaceae bacterium]|jgi:putative hydrolase of the HAD superfamily|uniref:pyrimidine 5'-nucleotidase n=1 Tax=Sphingorhabdus sp. TaxID=1902408 RepID=UPI003341C529|nr:pyrimidine 5'-nucleotidase [Sphingomonadaceae bacterium]MCF8498648.1 pyrimidine 5'-nucleotidase [Sphingomonadaceae bacterium]